MTQSVDIYPTILEFFGIDPAFSCRNRLHGHSLLPLISSPDVKLRDELIYGYFGKNVNVTDGEWVYYRSATAPDNGPLNVYTAMPTTIGHVYIPSYIEDLKKIDAGTFLTWTDYPVYRIPGNIIRTRDQTQSFKQTGEYIREHRLFHLPRDPYQKYQVNDPDAEMRMVRKLTESMLKHDAPMEQFSRLDLQFA